MRFYLYLAREIFRADGGGAALLPQGRGRPGISGSKMGRWRGLRRSSRGGSRGLGTPLAQNLIIRTDIGKATRSAEVAVPDFQSLMLPLLKVLGDGDEHSLHEVIETLADQFGADRRGEARTPPQRKAGEASQPGGVGEDVHEEGWPLGEHGKGQVPD